MMKLGIGIPTYNRYQSLRQTLRSIKKNTHTDFVGVVADDGSTDETVSMTDDAFHIMHCPNGGIARNKNRLLWRLFEIEKCDVVILIEDDVLITASGWHHKWVETAQRIGHVNLWPGDCMSCLAGTGSEMYPIYSHSTTGQVQAFSQHAITMIGYMDPRFIGYGFEHVEHSRRMIRSFLGGWVEGDKEYYVLHNSYGIETNTNVPSTGNDSDISYNTAVFEAARNDSGYKSPWLNEADKQQFISEASA